MLQQKLTPRFTPGACVDENPRGWRLSIPSGKADAKAYRFAQLDDYTRLSRGRFPHRFPLRFSLLARTSSDSIPGTWGFGLWNDPFGMSLGFGGSPFRLPALPNAVWFFGASEENYLSFKEPAGFDTGGTSIRSTQPAAVNGFLAQTFRSPKFHPLLIPAGLALPFSRKMTRRLLGKVIGEDGVQLWSPAARRRAQEQAPELQSVDPTQWHRYNLNWSLRRVSFNVDDALVFESPVSPNPPLGLVIWIDNQYAAFTPEGKMSMGVLENEEAWLEIRDVDLQFVK